ncbi:MAG: D-glycero-beta-D-manno-heptose 1,7-bisphosphate 7-phosphatase [bacterium]|nr:D-glycero-beta-D-manno-heptose 1,7-bisphosphate 7-phosphatase [bacterium]
MKPEAVFLDRDGVINEEVNYLGNPDELVLLPGAASAIRKLNQKGIKVIVVTNQSGVARGYFSEEAVAEVHKRLKELLAGESAYLDAIYYCPHHPEALLDRYKKDCFCRKPWPGMLEAAAYDLGLDLSKCCLVGDKMLDIEAGAAVGCQTILVLTGYGETELKEEKAVKPDAVAKDISRAVEMIITGQQ